MTTKDHQKETVAFYIGIDLVEKRSDVCGLDQEAWSHVRPRLLFP
jgi:hypothetical protein